MLFELEKETSGFAQWSGLTLNFNTFMDKVDHFSVFTSSTKSHNTSILNLSSHHHQFIGHKKSSFLS